MHKHLKIIPVRKLKINKLMYNFHIKFFFTSFLALFLEYFVSLPSNKLELWMALESGRFIAPVFRELYSEKEVSYGKISMWVFLFMRLIYLQYPIYLIVCKFRINNVYIWKNEWRIYLMITKRTFLAYETWQRL